MPNTTAKRLTIGNVIVAIAIVVFVVLYVADKTTTVEQVRRHILTEDPQAEFCRTYKKTSLYDKSFDAICARNGVNIVFLYTTAIRAGEALQNAEASCDR